MPRLAQVLNELAGDKGLEKFKGEYEKLYRAVKKSHENEKRLARKCRELSSEIVANTAKIQTAVKLSEEDQGTISGLKKEIQKAWKIVDASHEKEARAKETIQQLKVEVSNLNKMIEEGGSYGVGQESTLNELLKQKEELTEERDSQINMVVKLRNEIMEYQTKMRNSENEKLEFENELLALHETMQAKKLEAEREQRKKERMEKEIKELKDALESKQYDIKQKLHIVSQGEEHIARLEAKLRENKSTNDKITREYNGLADKVQRLQKELEEQKHLNNNTRIEISQKQMAIKQKEDEIATLKSEINKVNRARETANHKLKNVEKNKSEAEKQREVLRSELQTTEKDIENLRVSLNAEHKKLDELLRERDLLNKLKTQAENATQKQIDLVAINENTRKNLEQELQAYKVEAQRQNKLIEQLKKEREKYAIEASEATSKYLQQLEEIKLKELDIMDAQKKIAEGENRLKQQQNLYEAVRSDRNLYSKNLIEAQDEIQEMKRKFKILNHQIEQLKEEINTKDLSLVKEHFEHMKVEKEKENLRGDNNKARQQIKEADNAISSQKAEIEKLNHIINEADNERARQKKEYDQVVNERDILGTQLIRRNDELALLYEKIKIQQSTLLKGQAQYRDRLKEIRVLKIKINDLQRELQNLKSSVSNINVLKSEIHRLGRELLQERTKVKALSEELENPLNVHRWRKLEGSDPSTYEMIQKIQTLQKRLIAKTEEVVEKDTMISEKEKLYVELKNILARQPGPEVAEQLNVYQTMLREKTRQMKAMTSELNMYQAQVNEFKYEKERMTRELQELKRKYYEQKRKERMLRDSANVTNGGSEGPGGVPVGGPPMGAQPKRAGGGFALT